MQTIKYLEPVLIAALDDSKIDPRKPLVPPMMIFLPYVFLWSVVENLCSRTMSSL